MKKAEAYTDGSYNKSLGIYGCGAVLLIDGEAPQVFHETGRQPPQTAGILTARSGQRRWSLKRQSWPV